MLSEVFLVARIIRMGNKCYACRKQFGTGGLNIERCPVFAAESDLMIKTVVFTAFQLCLRNCSLECDVPQAGSLLLIRFPPCQIVQESALGYAPRMFTDRVVCLRPVDG